MNNLPISFASRRWLFASLTLSILSFSSLIPLSLLVWLCLCLSLAFAIDTRRLKVSSAMAKWGVLVSSMLLAWLFSWFGATVNQFVHLGLLAITLKLFELQHRKTARRFLLVCFFICSTALLLEQGISQMLLQLIVLVALLGTLLSLTVQNSESIKTRFIIKYVSTQFLICLPFMLLLFVFFPRLSAFWTMPDLSNQASTGLSDVINPGSIAQLSKSDALAFSVQFFEGESNISSMQNSETMYWQH